jgi:DeoR/GlpR family transcriptional regulator of sugar metabolism
MKTKTNCSECLALAIWNNDATTEELIARVGFSSSTIRKALASLEGAGKIAMKYDTMAWTWIAGPCQDVAA